MVLIENVAVLKSRGLDVVVDGLARAGYGCWWDVVSALAVGAPHLRERIWVVAVPYERMPDLVGEPFSEPRVKMPRAGASTARGLIEMVPCATQKAAKAAMGAVKRADGVTWLESIDTPLFPTPSSSSYGSNRGGAAGRVGPIRHSLESMARSGEWPEAMPHSPLPRSTTRATAATRRRVETPGGNHHAGTTLSDFTRMWPTPHGMSSPDAPRAGGPSGNELGNAVNNDVAVKKQRMFATPRSSDAERGGRGDLIQQVRGNKPTSAHGEQRVFPTPCQRDWKGSGLRVDGTREGHHTTLDSLPAVTRMWPTAAAAADGLGGPGGSPQRTGGLNLRTAVAEVEFVDEEQKIVVQTGGLLLSSIVAEAQVESPKSSHSAGSLSPDWTEWLMGLPVGWTDLSYDDPVQLDWLSEYGIPRVLRDVVDRKSRLMACGNTLVWKVAYTRLARALVLLGEDVPII